MTARNYFEFGLFGEREVKEFLRGRGVAVGPAPDTAGAALYRGPRIAADGAELIAPDLMAWANGAAAWLEIKRKRRWSYWETGGYPVTGIDLPVYEHYLAIARMSDIPLFLLFVMHGGAMAPGRGPGPEGLYGQNILTLAGNKNHEHKNGGPNGMVYWSERSLVRCNDLYASDFAALFRGETRGPDQPGIPGLRRPKNT
jgi:hypothetical protein